MDGELYQGAAYSGSKDYTQQQVKTANATGFGAAADDYAERGIDLNEQLIRNKPATFFMRVRGEAMIGAGIFDGDTVIVDRSIKPVSGKVVIAVLNGDMLIRLAPGELGLLRVLAARPGVAVSRTELSEQTGAALERTVDVQITRLRRKFEQDPRAPRYLQTVRGQGYVLWPD